MKVYFEISQSSIVTKITMSVKGAYQYLQIQSLNLGDLKFLDVDKSNENDIESNSDKNIGYEVGYVVLAKIILLVMFIIVRKYKKHTQ